MTVAAAGVPRTNGKPVEVELDFTALLAAVGQSQPFDEDSLWLVEVNTSGSLHQAPVGYQFNRRKGFDAATNARGTLIFLLDGATAAGEVRQYQLYFDAIGKSFAPFTPSKLVSFTPFVEDQGLNTFKIGTPVGDYYYDIVGGGFSSFDDVDGADWISWTTQGEQIFRGIPNMVFYLSGTGTMHPGKSGVTTTKLHDGPYNVQLHSVYVETLGTWEVIWDIFPTYARMTVLQAADDYWFLYEGTPGGEFDSADYLVRSDGSTSAWDRSWCRDTDGYADLALYCHESTGMWDEEWAYFVDPSAGSSGRALYVAHHENDDIVDYYAKHANDDYRMTVFGFGRLGSEDYQPHLVLPQQFTFGLMDVTAYADGAPIVRSAYHPLVVSVSSVELPVATDAGIATDSFNACVLDTSTWTAYGLDGAAALEMTGTKAALVVPGGTPHDLWNGSLTAPRLMQPVANGNFDVSARFVAPVETVLQMQGFVAMADTQNYLRFNVQHDSAGTHLVGISTVGGVSTVAFTHPIPPRDAPLYLRLVRNDNQWQLLYSYDPTDTEIPWQDAGGATTLVHGLAMTEFGLFAGNGGANPPSFTAQVDYVYRTGDAIPHDTRALTLADILASAPVEPPEVGTISGEPINSTPENPTCGDPFALTATSVANGYAFSGWQGNTFTDDRNPLVRSFEIDDHVLATFDRLVFPLHIAVVNQGKGDGGIVQVTPELPAYPYGTVVTATAASATGWQFGGWSGAITSTSPQIQMPITQTTEITATFNQDRYALNVAAKDQDNASLDTSLVIVSPPHDPDGYVYGEDVTLSISEDPSWTFVGWSTAVDGSDITTTTMTMTMTMTGPATVTAHFDRNFFTLQATVAAEGSGDVATGNVVEVSAPADSRGYVYNEAVTLSAVPASNWRFFRWEGDASGGDPQLELTMTASRRVTAVFATYQAYLPMIVP